MLKNTGLNRLAQVVGMTPPPLTASSSDKLSDNADQKNAHVETIEIFCSSFEAIELAMSAARTLMLRTDFPSTGEHSMKFLDPRAGVITGKTVDEYVVTVRPTSSELCLLSIYADCHGLGPLRSALLAKKVKGFARAVQIAAAIAGVVFRA
jgi:hypothetical protein